MKVKRFTRNTYHGTRGREMKRDPVLEILVSKPCAICSVSLERIRYENGNLETLTRFRQRKTCGKECKKILLTGSGNPHYKGIMDIACRICGKTGLCYRDADEKYDLCRKCWNENRGIPYNKKDDVTINCTGCNKEISNRWSGGSLRYKTPFCSKACSNKFHFKKDLLDKNTQV